MSGAHVRQQIRANAANALKAAGIVAPDSVLPGRRRPTTAVQLPALLVYTDDEASTSIARATEASGGRWVRQRQVQLVVRCRLATTGVPPQDELDALAVQVEQALDADESLGGLLTDLQYVRTESGVPSPMSDRQLGEIDIVYSAEFHTVAGDPTTSVIV